MEYCVAEISLCSPWQRVLILADKRASFNTAKGCSLRPCVGTFGQLQKDIRDSRGLHTTLACRLVDHTTLLFGLSPEATGTESSFIDFPVCT